MKFFLLMLAYILSVVASLVAGYIYGQSKIHKDGTLVINTSDPNKDIYSMEFNYPLNRIDDRKIFVFDVRHV